MTPHFKQPQGDVCGDCPHLLESEMVIKTKLKIPGKRSFYCKSFSVRLWEKDGNPMRVVGCIAEDE